MNEGQEKERTGEAKAKPDPEDASKKHDEHPFLEVEPGDYVRITDAALIDPVAQEMTPFLYFKLVGWPNKFMVVDTFVDVKHGQLLALDPCCAWAEDLEDRSKKACQAHPAKFFEKITAPSGGRSDGGDRYMGVNFGGYDLLSVEYLNGGKEPSLVVKFAGQKPFRVSGAAARSLCQFLQARGF